MTKEEFFSKTVDLCQEFGGSVTSGIRSPARNAAVGGVANSWHLTGYALDVVLDNWSRKDDFIARATRMGIKVVDEVQSKNHLHLQAY